MADQQAGDWSARAEYEIADARFWSDEKPTTEEKTMTDTSKATQGKAVAKALAGKRDEDVDGWKAFSPSDAKVLAQAPATPKRAVLPKAGLARNGGRVE